uniref:Uncharacterized protein n=1 Tax=Timema bartmani TaxID=61472 RepID=A0A7R9I0K7_9NEOP|nr:unnamed protein product [Timema bartmani]
MRKLELEQGVMIRAYPDLTMLLNCHHALNLRRLLGDLSDTTLPLATVSPNIRHTLRSLLRVCLLSKRSWVQFPAWLKIYH